MDYVDCSPVLSAMRFGEIIGDGYGLLSEKIFLEGLLSQGLIKSTTIIKGLRRRLGG